MADDGDGLVWPRERSEQVGDFRHFRVRQDWNRAPDTGDVRDFYVLDIQDWVQVIALTPEGRLVMVRQFRPGTRRVTTEFVAGLIEPGESPAEAAVRELEEETGHCGGTPRVIGEVDPNAALQNNRLFIVLVEDCRRTGTMNEDPGEVIEPVEVAPDEVDAMIADGRFQEAYGIVAWDYYRRNIGQRTANNPTATKG